MSSLAAEADFKSCEIVKSPVGMEIKPVRQQPLTEQAA
jgi:hypothetical protein